MLLHLFVIILASINSRSAAVSYNLPKFCPNASWNSSFTTFPNSVQPGFYAYGLFVSNINTIYISTRTAGEILMWLENDANSRQFANLNDALSIFVADTGEIYADQNSTHCVGKVTMNSSSSTTVMNTSQSCAGLFIDARNILYCSIAVKHYVIAQSLDNTSSINGTVAGNGSNGSVDGMLSYPYGIFVDSHLRLYVAECGNNRIQYFESGSLNGTVIVDTGGSPSIVLICPTSVVSDADNNLFILDDMGRRIVEFRDNRLRGIAGFSIMWTFSPPPLSYAEILSFDSYGNIYTAGHYQGVIRKFSLATNSCDDPTTTQRSESSPSMTFISSPNPTTTHRNTTMSPPTSPTAINSTSSEETTSTDRSSGPHTSTLAGVSVPSSFIAPTCQNSTRIGIHCNLSALHCDLPDLCQNNATCINVNTGYRCECAPGFNGTECQYDYRPCPPGKCWNNGTCTALTNTTFSCSCAMNWTGVYCQSKINYYENVHCENNGVCRPLLGDYQCECLGESFSGRHCEVKSTALVIHQTVCKSFASIAIVAIGSIIIFVVIMDVLKYVFGIDPTRHELERLRRRKRSRKAKPPVVQRFIYQNASPLSDP